MYLVIGLALFLTIIFALIGWWISKKISQHVKPSLEINDGMLSYLHLQFILTNLKHL